MAEVVSATTRGVEVTAEAFYLPEHSEPADDVYNFAYRIRLQNHGTDIVQLISRHWIITDSTGKVTEVQGEGVVGKQPVLAPGEAFEYVSGSRMESPMGTMQGTYQMIIPDGDEFDITIPTFALAVPSAIN